LIHKVDVVIIAKLRFVWYCVSMPTSHEDSGQGQKPVPPTSEINTASSPDATPASTSGGITDEELARFNSALFFARRGKKLVRSAERPGYFVVVEQDGSTDDSPPPTGDAVIISFPGPRTPIDH
jgi:hypothetical protein